ncbi:MAG: hypothetical protein V3U74_03925 [Thermodesulfobacteriota bacterium]
MNPTYSEDTDSNLPNPYVITYPFKSAVIHYSVKSEYGHGKTYEGADVVYIKGDKLAKVQSATVPKPGGKTGKVETLRIFTLEYVYIIDLINKTGIKIDNSKKYGKPAYNVLSAEEKKAFHNRMNRRGIVSLDLVGLGKKIGDETVLGRECDVYESGKQLSGKELLDSIESGEGFLYKKSWIWKEAKIPLRTITSRVGWSGEIVATKIEESPNIPASRFIVPPDIKITYDREKSEAGKRETLARFYLYKTGKSKIIRVKTKKEVLSHDKSTNPGTPNLPHPDNTGKTNALPAKQ